MIDRAEFSKAWSEGFTAGRKGDSQALNPYIGKNPPLAREWDAGWREGKGN